MNVAALRPRRLRYRTGSEPWGPIVSPTLPRRVLYGALFFYLAYCAHLAAFVGSDIDIDGPSPVADAGAAAIAPVDSGVLESAFLRLVQGDTAPTASSATTTTGSGT